MHAAARAAVGYVVSLHMNKLTNWKEAKEATRDVIQGIYDKSIESPEEQYHYHPHRETPYQEIAEIALRSVIANHVAIRLALGNIVSYASYMEIIDVDTNTMGTAMKAYYYTQIVNMCPKWHTDELKFRITNALGDDVLSKIWLQPKVTDILPFVSIPDLAHIVIQYSQGWITVENAIPWLLSLPVM